MGDSVAKEMAVKDVRAHQAISSRETVARHLSRIIFYALLVLILLVAVPYGTVEPWWEALFEFIVFVLGVLWIVEGMLSQSWLLAGHRIFVPLLLLDLFAFIQSLPLRAVSTTASGLRLWEAISADPYETRLSVIKLLALILAGVLLFRYTSSQRRLRALIYTVIGVGLLSAFFGIFRQTTQHSPGFFLPFLLPGAGYGQFINYNHFAFLMEMPLGLIMGLIIGRGVRRDRILIYLALALPIWIALILCNSRGGLFSMLAQMFLLALLFNFVRSRRDFEQVNEEQGHLGRTRHALVFRSLLVVGLMTAIFIVAIWIGGESLVTRLEYVPGELGAENAQLEEGNRRIDVWSATWRMFKDHPLLGVGFNGYWAAIPQYHKAPGDITPQQAHSDYLELLVSGGLVGVALTVWFFFYLGKGIRQSFRSRDSFRRAASIGASVGLFGVIVHSMGEFGLHVTINALVFTALVVIAIADSRVEEKKATSTKMRNQGHIAL